MDVLNDRILDIALNVAGYLIAGALGMLVYSVFRARRVATPQANAVPVAAPLVSNGGAHFVDLRATAAPATNPTGRRDKTEVVRLARRMMQAGADRDTIKRTVPISDGELNLLEVAGSVR